MSAAYLSTRSYSCLEEYGPQSGKEISAAAAPYLAARDLAAISKALGTPPNLQDAVMASKVQDSRLKMVKQQYGNLFTVYAVPDGVAPEFECDDQRALKDLEDARVTGMKKKYNRYYASVFRLVQPHETGQIITLLWTKEGAYWKLVSWDAEPEDAKPEPSPDTRSSQTAEAPEEHTKADPAMLQASHDFLREWLIKRNYVAATNYFSPKSYSCIGATIPSDQPKPTTTPQYLNYMQTAMQTVAQDLERVQHLPDVIEAADADHPGLKLVSHKGDNAYAVVAVPDNLAPAMMCQTGVGRASVSAGRIAGVQIRYLLRSAFCRADAGRASGGPVVSMGKGQRTVEDRRVPDGLAVGVKRRGRLRRLTVGVP